MSHLSDTLLRVAGSFRHPKSEHSFQQYVADKKFKSEKSGRGVKFRSLPTSQQRKIRKQWKRNEGKGAHRNEMGIDFGSHLRDLKRHVRDQLGGSKIGNLEHFVDDDGDETIGLDFKRDGENHEFYIHHTDNHEVLVVNHATGEEQSLNLEGHKNVEAAIMGAVDRLSKPKHAGSRFLAECLEEDSDTLKSVAKDLGWKVKGAKKIKRRIQRLLDDPDTDWDDLARKLGNAGWDDLEDHADDNPDSGDVPDSHPKPEKEVHPKTKLLQQHGDVLRERGFTEKQLQRATPETIQQIMDEGLENRGLSIMNDGRLVKIKPKSALRETGRTTPGGGTEFVYGPLSTERGEIQHLAHSKSYSTHRKNGKKARGVARSTGKTQHTSWSWRGDPSGHAWHFPDGSSIGVEHDPINREYVVKRTDKRGNPMSGTVFSGSLEDGINRLREEEGVSVPEESLLERQSSAGAVSKTSREVVRTLLTEFGVEDLSQLSPKQRREVMNAIEDAPEAKKTVKGVVVRAWMHGIIPPGKGPNKPSGPGPDPDCEQQDGSGDEEDETDAFFGPGATGTQNMRVQPAPDGNPNLDEFRHWPNG